MAAGAAKGGGAAGGKAARGKAAGSNRAPLGFWGLGVATGVLLGVALPTGILLAVGLIPSALAALADRSPGRSVARTVLAFNLAGLVPALRSLWLEGHSLTTLGSVLLRLDALPLAYSGALIGAALPVVLSWAVFAVLEARAFAKIRALEAQRAALRETWGQEVESPATGIMAKGPSTG